MTNAFSLARITNLEISLLGISVKVATPNVYNAGNCRYIYFAYLHHVLGVTKRQLALNAPLRKFWSMENADARLVKCSNKYS